MKHDFSDAPEMRMIAVPKRHTAGRLADLEVEVAELRGEVTKGRRQRKLFWIALAGLSVGLVVALSLIVYLLVGRSDSRRYYNDSICMLIDAVSPDRETHDLLRERAHCPHVARATDSSGAASAPAQR